MGILEGIHFHIVEVTVLYGPQDGHLNRYGHGLILRLLEHFHDALAPLKLGARGLVEVAAKLRERRQLAELREVQLDGSRNLLHRLHLRGGAHAADRQAHRNRRAHALIKQICFQKQLAVGDGNHVRRNVRGYVARLRLDDGQRRERSAAGVFGQARRALEQPAVQIKHVTRKCLAAGRAFQHQRHLPVRHRVLGQIVVNNQRVHVVVHEPLAHRRTGEGREVLVGGRIARGGGHHDGVFQRAVFLEILDDLRHVCTFLADGHVNRIKRPEILVAALDAFLVDAGIVDDGVDANRRLASLAVADDQLALAAADRDHRVHRHDTGLHRLADRLALDDARRNFLHRITLLRGNLTLAIDRPTQRIHHTPEQRLADGHGQQLAGGFHLVALGDAGVVAENHRAHFRLLEVQSEAHHAVAEVEHLVHHRASEALDLGHAVTDFAHRAHVLARHLGFHAGDLGFNFP